MKEFSVPNIDKESPDETDRHALEALHGVSLQLVGNNSNETNVCMLTIIFIKTWHSILCLEQH